MTDFAEVFIDQGQDIRKTIEAFVIEKGWKEVIVVNAIGSVKDLILAAPISNELPLKVGRTPCYGAAEILSFTSMPVVPVPAGWSWEADCGAVRLSGACGCSSGRWNEGNGLFSTLSRTPVLENWN